MRLLDIILGGVVAGVCATSVAANPLPDPRPAVSSVVNPVVMGAAQPAGSQPAFRPVARPVHMIRYPVEVIAGAPPLRPQLRPLLIPDTRWGDDGKARAWAQAGMSAVADHALDSVVPQDIATWCPGYAANSPSERRAFWVGLMSALSRYESGHNPSAVGGGGQWFGLMQISPATARGAGCDATSGDALKDPVANLTCAADIMGHAARRSGAAAVGRGGVTSDWGPMSDAGKVSDMAAWTRAQDYCEMPVSRTTLRPVARPRDILMARSD